MDATENVALEGVDAVQNEPSVVVLKYVSIAGSPEEPIVSAAECICTQRLVTDRGM